MSRRVESRRRFSSYREKGQITGNVKWTDTVMPCIKARVRRRKIKTLVVDVILYISSCYILTPCKSCLVISYSEYRPF